MRQRGKATPELARSAFRGVTPPPPPPPHLSLTELIVVSCAPRNGDVAQFAPGASVQPGTGKSSSGHEPGGSPAPTRGGGGLELKGLGRGWGRAWTFNRSNAAEYRSAVRRPVKQYVYELKSGVPADFSLVTHWQLDVATCSVSPSRSRKMSCVETIEPPETAV